MSNGNLLAIGLGLAGFMMGTVGAYFGFKSDNDTDWLHEQYESDSETLAALSEELNATKGGLRAANLQVAAAREESQAVTTQLKALQKIVFDLDYRVENSIGKTPIPRIGSDASGAGNTDLLAVATLTALRRKLSEGTATGEDLTSAVHLAETLERLPALVDDLARALAASPDDDLLKKAHDEAVKRLGPEIKDEGR